MFRDNPAMRQFFSILLGETVCVAAMLAVYLLIGRFTGRAVIGAVFGEVATMVYFFSITVVVSRAADRVESGSEASKAKASVQMSSTIRLLVLAVVYVIVLKSGVCDIIAAILPLIFLRVSIMLAEFFHKAGDKK